jgi:hypothetical protein
MKTINSRIRSINLLKGKISEIEYDLEDSDEEFELQKLGEEIVKLSKEAIEGIGEFRESSPIFDSTFIFKNNVRIEWIDF